MDIAYAGGSAARRLDGRVVGKAWADGSASTIFGDRVLDIEWAGGSAARRFGGQILVRKRGDTYLAWAKETGGVHARPVATKFAEVAGGEGKGRDGNAGAGGKGVERTQANAEFGRLVRNRMLGRYKCPRCRGWYSGWV